MSWLVGLYETFENNKALLHAPGDSLTPICHTTQQAHLEVVLDGHGQFLRASVVPRECNTTLTPCTESSSSRSGSKPTNHPLCDKLQYLAGDFADFGGVVTSGFSKEPTEPYLTFLHDLTQWANSPYGHPKIAAVLRYVEKGSLISDLVNYGILPVNAQGKLVVRRTGQDECPEIFTVLPANQSPCDAFVRWVVEIPGVFEAAVWRDEALIQAWIDYYVSTIADHDICYATGEDKAIALFHPAKIRNDGDKAKLISGNDDAGFTFRGRFEGHLQAAVVGFEVTQKAHNMLRWLVRNQGFRSGDLAIVAWTSGGERVPNPVYDSISFLGTPEESDVAYTAEEFASKLRRKILSYQQGLGEFTDINVIALNSATPGRMSISFYRELWSSEFLRRLEYWHETYAWRHSYRPRGAGESFPREYVGTTSLFDIAEAAYGVRLDPRLRARTIERLLPCVIDGHPLPSDIVNATVRRATNRVAFMEEWEWRKTLTIACGLYKGAHIEEGYTLALDPHRTTRDYLYGRLLAHADNLEKWALKESNEQRPTNAARTMNRFAERPFSAWRNLELALRPYKDRLGPRRTYKLERGISEVMDLFRPEDFTNDRPLSGEFLLGYHSQLMAFWQNDEGESIS